MSQELVNASAQARRDMFSSMMDRDTPSQVIDGLVEALAPTRRAEELVAAGEKALGYQDAPVPSLQHGGWLESPRIDTYSQHDDYWMIGEGNYGVTDIVVPNNPKGAHYVWTSEGLEREVRGGNVDGLSKALLLRVNSDGHVQPFTDLVGEMDVGVLGQAIRSNYLTARQYVRRIPVEELGQSRIYLLKGTNEFDLAGIWEQNAIATGAVAILDTKSAARYKQKE